MIKLKTTDIPLILELRDPIKSMVETELDHMSERLEGLNDRERLDAVLKLISFVLKAQPVHHAANQPFDWTDRSRSNSTECRISPN